MPNDDSVCTNFREGQAVRYTGPAFDDLPGGSVGVVLWPPPWPYYEVEFTHTDGRVRDAIYDEAELEAA